MSSTSHDEIVREAFFAWERAGRPMLSQQQQDQMYLDAMERIRLRQSLGPHAVGGTLPHSTNGLPDIDDVAPLSADDHACIEEVKAVLAKHGKLERFGISLLHSHFPVAEDEMLIEYSDDAKRELTIRPVPTSELEGSQIKETNWRLDTEESTANCTFACIPGCNYSHHDRHCSIEDAEYYNGLSNP